MNVIDYLTFGKGDLKERVNNVLDAYGVKRKKEVPLMEMARIDKNYNGNTGFYKDFKVYVYGNEGNHEPHLHIFNNEKSIELKVYLRNLEVMSIREGSKLLKDTDGASWEGYMDIRENLIKMLKSPFKDSGLESKNRYELACSQWNLTDNEKEIKNSERLNISKFK